MPLSRILRDGSSTRSITDSGTTSNITIDGSGIIDTPGYRLNGEPFTGGAKDGVFYENDAVITVNYTITAGKNAGTFGPVTVADGVEVTVPADSVWTIV